MRIAIDARWIFPQISGIGNYTRQLIRQLIFIDKENDYLIIFNDKSLLTRTIVETGIGEAPNFKAVCVSYGVFSPLSQICLPFFLRRRKIDLFHSPNYMIPFLGFPKKRAGHIRVITTIHDLIPLIFPDHAPKSKKSRLFPLFKKILLEAGARSDAIITVSKASRGDIIKHLQIPKDKENKVRAIYNGVSDQFKPGNDSADKLHKTIGDPRKILYVGRADPYKNLSTLIKAVDIASRSYESPVSLIIAGSPDPRYPEPEQLVEKLELQNLVEWTGYISDSKLVETYQTADILVHPSQYEGFGLQIIEAMACGTPVICSNCGALKEVAGDAAILVDPSDTSKFAEEIIRILSDSTLIKDMISKGLVRASEFRWQKTAQETLELYASMAQVPSVGD